jgi:hypothetical protein
MTTRDSRKTTDAAEVMDELQGVRKNQKGAAYTPALWERILAAACAVAVLVIVFIVILRKPSSLDQNQVVLIRIVLSLAVSVIGGVIPGFLQVSLRGRGIAIRAGGALALFVVTYFFSPKVLPLSISKEQLDKLERSTEETRDQMARMVTKFTSVFVQAVYELPQTEPDIGTLKDCLAEIGQKTRERNRPLPKGLQLSYSYSASDQKAPEQPIVSIDLDDVLGEDFVNLSPKLMDLVNLVSFLKQPTLQIGINRVPKNKSALTQGFLGYSDPADLRLFAHAWPVDPPKGHFGKVILDPRHDQVLVSWNGFDYPPDRWGTSLKVVSIQDLDHAQLAVMLSGTGNVDARIDKVAAGCVPVWINIKFDNSFVSFVDLERLQAHAQWQAFAATFPSAQEILEGKASHSLDPAYSWGF